MVIETHEEDFALEVGVAVALVDHVGCGISDREVEEPVCSGGHGETLRTDLEREQLSGYNPSDGSPRASDCHRVSLLALIPERTELTEEDIDAHKGDSGLLCCEIGRAGHSSGDSDNELTDAHANGSHEQ